MAAEQKATELQGKGRLKKCKQKTLGMIQVKAF